MGLTCLLRQFSAALLAVVCGCGPAIVLAIWGCFDGSDDGVRLGSRRCSWTDSCDWLVRWFLGQYLERVGSGGLRMVLAVVLSMTLARASTDV